MAKAIRMKDESGQLLPVTNGVLVQYNSSYSVSSYISNLVEEIANTEAATAAALTTLNHKDNVIMGYIDDMRATYVTYSYLNSFLDTEILPAIPTVDNRILSSSENPVQNKVIYEALEDVRVTVDTALDASSYNPVRNSVITQTIINNENTTSQALHGLDTRVTYLETAYTYLSDIDDELSETSYKAVTNAAITQEFNTLSDVTATALTDHNNRITDLETAYTYFSDIDDELSATSYKALTNARITQEFDTLSDVTATALTDHENRLNVIERRFNVVDNTATEVNNRLTALENYKNNTLPTILDGFRTTDADLTTRINALEQSLALVNTLLNTIVYGAQEV